MVTELKPMALGNW